MNRHARKVIPPRRHHKPLPEPEAPKFKIPGSTVVLIVIAIVAGIPFALGKYFEFNSPDPFDSGSYAYSAAHILHGARIGVEEVPSALLGTLLVNIVGVRLFGFSDFGPKVIQMILQAAALILMFITMRRLFGTLSAAVGIIIASVYLSAPLIAKYGNVKEQYMIAFAVIGASCFVLYQLNGKWWLAVLAGAFVSWAPLFKETGTAGIGAIGLFVIIQPILRRRTFRQTGRDILLLLGGAAAAIGPLYVWILGWHVQTGLPYNFVPYTLAKFIPAGAGGAAAPSDYISEGRKLVPFSQQWPIVLRYYGLLVLPVALAIASILARILRLVCPVVSAKRPEPKGYDRFVLLFAVWWALDMAFVWISPHSYEQYYLPLNASAAMLGGYLVAIYYDKARSAASKPQWIAVGAVGLLAMIITSWHIFFGITTSPHTGTKYTDSAGNIARTRGYSQKFEEICQRRRGNLKGPWEAVGEYIRENSEPNDKIYVWGWYPGIYVAAQRFSSSSRSAMMPRPAPAALATMIAELLDEFKNQMPKFIVDSRKRHIPTERPPYELWPIMPRGFMGIQKEQFLPANKTVVGQYDKQWRDLLAKEFDEDEALRYDKLKPLREFVMDNYRIVQMFGTHVLFELKKPTATKTEGP